MAFWRDLKSKESTTPGGKNMKTNLQTKHLTHYTVILYILVADS